MPSSVTEQDILSTCLQWLQEGHRCVLVTVLKTWGSSPRPPGSLLVIRQDGALAGSVSGGCVEEDLLQRYTQQQLDNLPTRIDYGVNREDVTRFGLPCGGRLELLVEDFNDMIQCRRLLDAMQQRQLISRQVDLRTGQARLKPASTDQGFLYTNIYVQKLFGPRWHMLLIGAGHLSQSVSQLGLMLDYHVIVCDPREEYARSWQVEGTELVSMMPDDAVIQYADHPRSIVLALTHDPKLDDMALLDALNSPAFYVGAIGSKRNCQLRRQRLLQLGVTPHQLEHLHAPIGLPIGSHTPPEIAIAILAEITAMRNSVDKTAIHSESAA